MPTELRANEGIVECPVCLRSVSAVALAMAGPLRQFRNHDGRVVSGRTRTKRAPRLPVESVAYNDAVEGEGQLQPIAARVLMKILYAARMCRFDLLRAVCGLAQRITRWDATCDRRLLRVVEYAHSLLGKCLVGYVGNTPHELRPLLYADADMAGCSETQRSTTGVHHCISGSHTRFPIASVSKRQGCVSHSTPEVEIVSRCHAVQKIGIPSSEIWISCCLTPS